MEKNHIILTSVFVLLVTFVSSVVAFPLDMEASVSQEIVELGETITMTVSEFDLTDREDWTWHGKVIRYGADGSEVVVKEGSGTVKAKPANVLWTVDLTAPSSFPVETFYWHGEVPYLKYVVRVSLKNQKKLIGIGMAKTFVLVNERQDIIDFLNDPMLVKTDNLINAADQELTTKIDARIAACREGNKTDEEVATRWEAIKSGIQAIKTDAEAIKDKINIGISDPSIKNLKEADDMVRGFWDTHGETRDEYHTLVDLTLENCAETEA